MKEHAKKALKHDISVAGKTIPTLILVGLFLVGGGSAALLSTFGTVTGTATVDNQAITLDETAFSFDSTQTAGETIVEKRTLTSHADVATQVAFKSTCQMDSNTELSQQGQEADWTGDCKGIDTEYVEYFDNAGANLSDYKSPSNCDYTASSSTQLQDLVDGTDDQADVAGEASTGETVCVDSSITGEIDIEQSGITVASTGDALSTISAGSGPVVDIYADDVIFTGFDVGNTGSGTYASGQAVHVQAESSSNDDGADNITVSYVDAQSNDKAVVVDYSENVTLRHIDATAEGDEAVTIWVSSNVNIEHVTAHDSGDPSDPGQEVDGELDTGIFIDGSDVTVTESVLRNNEDGGVVAEDWNTNAVDVSSITLSRNNFLGDQTDVIERNTVNDITVSAGDNYFGSDGIQTQGDVTDSYADKTDTTIEAGSTDSFGILNEFAINLEPSDYTLTAKVLPAGEDYETPS